MNCPRDSAELAQASLGGSLSLCCPECQGYFIGLSGSRVKGVDLAKLNPKVAANAFCQSGKRLISPASGEVMKYFEYKGIKLDYCVSTHAIWMDHGEFERIMRLCNQKTEKEDTNSGSVIHDVATDGVFEFIGDAVFSLFDGW